MDVGTLRLSVNYLSYQKGVTNLVVDSLSRADFQAVQFLPATSDLPLPLPQLTSLQQHNLTH